MNPAQNKVASASADGLAAAKTLAPHSPLGDGGNPKNIIVRNKAGHVRRCRKTDLKWYGDRGFIPDK